jgi:hypothetical protein
VQTGSKQPVRRNKLSLRTHEVICWSLNDSFTPRRLPGRYFLRGNPEETPHFNQRIRSWIGPAAGLKTFEKRKSLAHCEKRVAIP